MFKQGAGQQPAKMSSVEAGKHLSWLSDKRHPHSLKSKRIVKRGTWLNICGLDLNSLVKRNGSTTETAHGRMLTELQRYHRQYLQKKGMWRWVCRRP